MLPNYEILYLFESSSIFITEIKIKGLPEGSDLSKIYHWLYFDKTSGALIKLWFKSIDSSPSVEERYFEQGYLKFNLTTATFIEKFNSSQHTLDNRTTATPKQELVKIIHEYLEVL